MPEFAVLLRHNIVLITAVTAWLTAQILKTFTAYLKNRRFQAERLIGTGGMPSSHTALVVGLASAVGFRDGVDVPLFALAVVLAGIVMYDAAGVRRAAGRHAKAINKLARHVRARTQTTAHHNIYDTKLKELLGHTPVEVLAGAILGFVIAYLFHVYW